MDQDRSPRRFAAKTRPRLILGGLAAATTISLSACSSGPPQFQNAEFTTIAACTTAGFPAEVCSAEYNAAFLEHQRSAPQFKSRADCEKDWGSNECTPLSAGTTNPGSSISSFFVPALAGFVVSQALQQRFYDNGGIDIDYYGGYGTYRGSPIYRNRGGSMVTLDRSGGQAVARPVNVNTRTVSASGFGGRGLSRGSSGWGG